MLIIMIVAYFVNHFVQTYCICIVLISDMLFFFLNLSITKRQQKRPTSFEISPFLFASLNRLYAAISHSTLTNFVSCDQL